MAQKQIEEKIIQSFQKEEKMMILVFAQWCINHDLDPLKLYFLAYPDQAANRALQEAMELTVPKDEAGEISNEMLLNVLTLFGNEDLAFVVTEEIKKGKMKN